MGFLFLECTPSFSSSSSSSLLQQKNKPTVHIVFSVQEEFNLRGVLPVINTLKPNIAIQVDLTLTSDKRQTVRVQKTYKGILASNSVSKI